MNKTVQDLSTKTELTPEETKKLAEYREKYIAIGTSTHPMDREKAAEAVKELYRLSGLKEPRIEYADDPVKAQIRANILIGNKPKNFEFLRCYLDGQIDASMIGYYKFFIDELGLVVSDQHALDMFHAMEKLVSSCMWVIELNDTAIICDRPRVFMVDENMRLHCDYDSAIEWSTGLRFYFIHGIEVPEKVVMAPETLTIDEIRHENNVEIRRIMMQRYGWEKYLRVANAKIIDCQPDPGVPDHDLMLYEFFDENPERHANEPIHILRVWNGTPEEDGSHKEYALRVSHEIFDAFEAVLSTYPGITREDYINMVRA
jgi:hypothetical protein